MEPGSAATLGQRRTASVLGVKMKSDIVDTILALALCQGTIATAITMLEAGNNEGALRVLRLELDRMDMMFTEEIDVQAGDNGSGAPESD